MTKTFVTTLLFISSATLLYSCKKPFVCICSGGKPYQVYQNEVHATDSRKAAEKCEANNQPPTTADVINCGLK